MFSKTMGYQSADQEAIHILKDFLPDRLFDAHAHLLNTSYLPAVEKSLPERLCLDLQTYYTDMRPLLGSTKQLRLNIIPYPDSTMSDPTSGNLQKSDDFLIEQLNQDPDNVGEIMVSPNETAQDLEKRLIHPGIRGFKCYYLLASGKDTSHADICEYLPESAWEVADKHRMVITLHLVKDHALADPVNLKYIQETAKRYPNATLILAHAARAFASWTAVESVKELAGADNVWFDFSAVCESPAMLQIISKAGIERCMWGSDYPICRGRGKAISLADSFYWINQNDISNFASGSALKSWHIITENLMATRQACILADLNQDRIEDLFYNNAARLWRAK